MKLLPGHARRSLALRMLRASLLAAMLLPQQSFAQAEPVKHGFFGALSRFARS